MKTPLRSYHPVPSLQKSDGNLQDAPRIKNCLKAALLPFEFKTPAPSTPNEIREKAVCARPYTLYPYLLSSMYSARDSFHRRVS